MDGFGKEVMTLIQETFNEKDVLDIAMYIVSAQAVTEVTEQAIMGRQSEISGLSPYALQLAYEYDSALTTNEFFLKHYSVLRAFVIFDKIRIAALRKMFIVADKENDKDAFKAIQHLMFCKMDALVMLAFLWKGYEFAAEFMAKLRLVFRLSPEAEMYFEQKL